MTFDYSKYEGAVIRNIRRGRGNILYAELVAADGELIIGATLEYITKALNTRMAWLPKEVV